ncbi:DUF7685 domain-containing protein [Caballeronia temeraria]|uniref:DUF7685 domain-containing protein n=1 Tax=Caballeronia temeraria TaxID=1777137 RepID=UPI0040430CF4
MRQCPSNERHPAGALMTQSRCKRCSANGPAHDFVTAESDGTWRVLCSRCFNAEIAQFAVKQAFEHPSFTRLRLRDAHDNDHDFTSAVCRSAIGFPWKHSNWLATTRPRATAFRSWANPIPSRSPCWKNSSRR